jgi:hypothetical protein
MQLAKSNGTTRRPERKSPVILPTKIFIDITEKKPLYKTGELVLPAEGAVPLATLIMPLFRLQGCSG